MLLSELLPHIAHREVLEMVDFQVSAVDARPNRASPTTVHAAIDEFVSPNTWFKGSALSAYWELGEIGAILLPSALPPREQLSAARTVATQILVEDPRRALAEAARAFRGFPDRNMRMVGVTGTNGKTTTTQLIAHLGTAAFGSAACMGTLGVWLDGQPVAPMDYTTPLAPEFYGHLGALRAQQTDLVAVEVSSHALALDRTYGCQWAATVVTNCTRDHLDFHGNVEGYQEAKRKLVTDRPPGCPAIINGRDPVAAGFGNGAEGTVMRFSIDQKGPAVLRADNIRCSIEGTRFDFVMAGQRFPARTGLLGKFQVENILAAVSTMLALGCRIEDLLGPLRSFPCVAGRIEPFRLGNGVTAVVDYAHNPDGLEMVLRNCRELAPARVILVFGCGGDRDRGKRSIMGRIAENGADRVWVTSDNPRTEDPESIIRDIISGIKQPERMRIEPDREAAIQGAFRECEPGDLLLVAGKGHEDYQIIGTEKRHFSDREIVQGLK